MGLDWREIDQYPVDLKFSVFSSKDVKKLSVVKIITGITFDSLGRALTGGLYDPIMGAYGRSMDPCQSCFSMSQCPGHFGHIELNALVYNPFFMKLVHDILKMSCLHCFRLQFKEHFLQILCIQLDLADAGFITEAQELEIFKSEVVFNEEATRVKSEDTGEKLHPKIVEMQDLLSKGVQTLKTKTSCAIRTAIVHDAMQNAAVQKCCYCNSVMKKIRYLYKKLTINITSSEREILKEQNVIREGNASNKVILADECRQYLRQIYENSSEILKRLFPVLKNSSNNIACPVDCFFLETVLVTPPKARPTNVLNDEILENPQTVIYRNIIESNSILRLVLLNIKRHDLELNAESKAVYESARGSTAFEKMYYAWQELQTNVDQLLDVSLNSDKVKTQGLKQILEKKEGLIRKNMMGKRVNFAARSVITPDPNVNVDELGIPEIFAKKLSYPVPVTSWNISELRQMVMNGPDIHPGANYIEDEKGYKTMIPADNPRKRESMAKLLLTKPKDGVKIVHRHLLNGDILLFNRQPSLHKPSIMAHKARILQGEKTFRLHYSNCKAYNADFDGDEMNAHFPQSEVARSEAYNLVNVGNQYLVPKDGTPLGGLIQDHIISGVKLSIRGRFFNREDYHQLVYQGLSHMKCNIKLLPPTIIKPCRLWSGKQVLSTILINIVPKGYPIISLTSTAKINAKAWQKEKPHKWKHGGTILKGNDMSEAEVIIRNGELIVGVLDKQQYGATQYGLVHCMYELYGGDCSTQLLTSFTRIFTYFLQLEGFSLGVRDILIIAEADVARSEIIKECREVGNAITAKALGLDEEIPPNILFEKMKEAYIKNPKFRVILDRKYKSVLDNYTNNINNACLPAGLLSQFPDNNLQLMVLSGAKGSLVNTMQISCLLGQIELEGKRPPLMISGKSLPSFPNFETSPKSGGFIDGRFMTGIQPQDFFFHCMAGREGLIDTAVKTSRSGYLQRCLVKHLEGLSVNYDLTVRDSDNCIVQFLYGEDGMDVCKSQFFNMKNMKFLEENADVILHSTRNENRETDLQIEKYHKKLRSWRKKHRNQHLNGRQSSFKQFSAEIRDEIEVKSPTKLNKKTGRMKIDEKIIGLWKLADSEKKDSYSKKYGPCPDPINSKYQPDNYYGAISEYLQNLMDTYMTKERQSGGEIRDVLFTKSMQAMAAPGEPVGLLAAQSIGEPSTQMTLNTFHFAGRGEMNVTLGIPRLREILMLASANIKTPSMDIPFKPNQEKNAERLRVKFNRVTLADVLEYINIKHRLVLSQDPAYRYDLYLKFLPKDAYEEEFCVKPRQILKYTSQTFFKFMFRSILKSVTSKHNSVEIGEKETKENAADDDDDRDNQEKPPGRRTDTIDSSDEEAEPGEDDANDIKLKSKKQDETEYDDPDDEEECRDANDDDDESANDLLDAPNEEDDDLNKESEDNEMQENVMNMNMVSEYSYDRVNYLWCKLTFILPLKYKKLDISHILKEVAKKAVVHEVADIKRAITYMNNEDLTLKTDGINIVEMLKYNKILDLNRLYTNDIHAIARTYGIEAASRVIAKEVKNVFQVYGITVNPRHLLLIADYMTFDGTFKPLSRKGMEFSSSPLQQMSFESCLQFLKSAMISGRQDDLGSPSGRLMVGLPIKNGTGSFSLLTKIC